MQNSSAICLLFQFVILGQNVSAAENIFQNLEGQNLLRAYQVLGLD